MTKRNSAFLFRPAGDPVKVKSGAKSLTLTVPMAENVCGGIISNWSDYSTVEHAKIWGVPIFSHELTEWRDGACEEIEDFLGCVIAVFLDLAFNDDTRDGRTCREALEAVGANMDCRERKYLRPFAHYHPETLGVPGRLPWSGYLTLMERQNEFLAYRAANGITDAAEAGRRFLEDKGDF